MEDHLKSVECFDPANGVWTELGELPTILRSHSALSYGNNLLLMGGSGSGKAFNSVLKMEESGQWSELSPMKTPRICFSAEILDNEIFITGGEQPFVGWMSSSEIFDGGSWRDGPSLPCELVDMPSVVIPQCLADALCNYKNSEQ